MYQRRNKRKRSELGQWYADHLKSLSLGDTVAKTAIFKINGRDIHIDIPIDMWRKAVASHNVKIKMMVVIREMAIHQRKGTAS